MNFFLKNILQESSYALCSLYCCDHQQICIHLCKRNIKPSGANKLC